MELTTIACLSVDLTAGAKLALTNPVLHRGTVLLTAGTVELLGGGVPRLEAARQRLLTHWNQPLGCSLLTVQVWRLSRVRVAMTHTFAMHLRAVAESATIAWRF